MRRAIGRFVDELRRAGLRLSIAESIDAVAAAAVVGIERERLREALAAALVKDELDRDAFDEAFDRFFAAGDETASARTKTAGGPEGDRPGRRRGESGRGGTPPRDESPPPSAKTRASPVPPRGEHAPSAEANEDRGGRDRRRARALLAKPFRDMDPLESETLDVLARELVRRFRGRLRRRLRRARRGRLDFRRTFRRSITRGGVAFELELRRPRPGRIDVVALCDVSGSVRTAVDLFAAVLGPCADLLRSLRVVAFVDRPVEAAIEGGRLVPDGPIDVHAFSDLGRVLVEIERAGTLGLGRGTLLLVLGDARNNRKPARADVLARLRRRARAVWWLVPEPRARWNTSDSAIAAYAPHCDVLLECATPAALVAALDRLPLGR